MTECLVNIDCRVISEPIIKADYGIEKIYECCVSVPGTNGKMNNITLNFSNSVNCEIKEGTNLYVEGDIRSIRHKTESLNNPLRVYIFGTNITKLPDDADLTRNQIEMTGIVSNVPRLRKAFNNDNIDVSELTVKLVRAENRFSYIPVVAWNSLARLTANINRGDRVRLKGNIQSHYTLQGRLMIEVSAYSISIITEE